MCRGRTLQNWILSCGDNYSIYGNIGCVVRALQAIFKPPARHVMRSTKKLGNKTRPILNNNDHKNDSFNDRNC